MPKSAPFLKIAGRPIGPGHPPYVIAELSANHAGSLERAIAILEAAADAGADAVKLQTYTADTMTIDHDGPGFRIEGGLWDGRSLYELYQEAHTPWDWHPALFRRGRELGVAVFSTPFDGSSLEFLEGFDPPAYKIASFEATDLPLIERVARTGKPLILSTGLCELEEISRAVEATRKAGCRDLALLHCVSAYPTPLEECDLLTLPDLSRRFGVVTGLSDHTLGTTAPVAAVALGAAIVEKHVTLRRADGGPDAAFSLEPGELAQVVATCADAWRTLGSVSYQPKPSEAQNLVFRRSLYVVADISAGQPFDLDNVRCIRPGLGLAPGHLGQVLGRKASRPLRRGTPLAWDMVE